MILAYNSDERFAGIFATSVLSLFECNKDEDEITVYLIEDHISEESKSRFQSIAEQYGRTIITIPMPDLAKLAGVDIAIPAYNRMATCGRLFIASCLPKDIDKVIYADCDIIFMKSLHELWETDISSYDLGMVDDGQSTAHREVLGIPRDGIYFNSGIMLVNLKRWRDNRLEQKFVRYMHDRGGYVPIPDQGTLNAVCDGKILCLPLKYNVYGILYAFNYDELLRTRKPPHFYAREEFEDAVNDPVAVHFTTCVFLPIRPWVKGCTHPYARKFLEYRSKTPWGNEPLWENNQPFLRRCYSAYFNAVPKDVSVFTSRIIYVYLIPTRHRLNRWIHAHKPSRKEIISSGGGGLIELVELLEAVYLVNSSARHAAFAKEAA